MKEFVLRLLCKPPEQRVKPECDYVLPWFRKYSKVTLNSIDKDVLVELIQNCELQSTRENELIIVQGEIGSCFYILIEGQVSVYVREGDYADILELIRKSATPETLVSRKYLGKNVFVGGDGYAFGEFALLSDTCLRNASVISDAPCCLMKINRELYNRCLKHPQEAEMRRRVAFIEKCSLFSEWNAQLKGLLRMSLQSGSVLFDYDVISQGDDFNGLFFITSGDAKLLLDASKHETQFNEFYPLDDSAFDTTFLEFPDLKYKPKRNNASSNANHQNECVELAGPFGAAKDAANEMTTHSNNNNNNNSGINGITCNSNDHHAHSLSPHAAAAHFGGKNGGGEICVVQSGDVIGDLENVLGVRSYLHSLRCATDHLTYYLLDLKNLERIQRRIPANFLQDLQHQLTSLCVKKLITRRKYYLQNEAFLLLHLEQKLIYEIFKRDLQRRKENSGLYGSRRKQTASLSPLSPSSPLLSEREDSRLQLKTRKKPPNLNQAWQYVLKMFMDGKAELILSSARQSDGIYYKDLMQNNAKRRARQREIKLKKNKSGDFEMAESSSSSALYKTEVASSLSPAWFKRGGGEPLAKNQSGTNAVIPPENLHPDNSKAKKQVRIRDESEQPANNAVNNAVKQSNKNSNSRVGAAATATFGSLAGIAESNEDAKEARGVWRQRSKFNRAMMRHRLSQIRRHQETVDWETSEDSLQYLEKRIRQFRKDCKTFSLATATELGGVNQLGHALLPLSFRISGGRPPDKCSDDAAAEQHEDAELDETWWANRQRHRSKSRVIQSKCVLPPASPPIGWKSAQQFILEQQPERTIILPPLKRYDKIKNKNPVKGGRVVIKPSKCSAMIDNYCVVNHQCNRFHIVDSLPEMEKFELSQLYMKLFFSNLKKNEASPSARRHTPVSKHTSTAAIAATATATATTLATPVSTGRNVTEAKRN